MASECPNRRIVSMPEEDSDEEVIKNSQNDSAILSEEEEVTYADEGESLIMQSNLTNGHEGEEDWLRKSIFHTRCTSHGKVCNVIIDDGSFENVVSTQMVERLCLLAEPHQMLDPHS